jgi:hypothetical protein
MCDKSMFGLCVAGHVGRFAVTQFGHKVSNGPLWVITNTVCSYATRVQEVDSTAFVDDIFNALGVPPHGACQGLEGACSVCMAALDRATPKMQFLDKLMKDCGLEYSVKGDMAVRQRHVYIGIIFDTLQGRLFISKEKFDKLLQLLYEMLQQSECSPRSMAKLRGKCGHQFRCIEGVGPFLVPFNEFIGGPETVREWDEPKPISFHLHDTMKTLRQWLPELQPAGAAMWPLEPATLLFRWENNLPVPGWPLVVAYWDASPLSVGVTVRDRPDHILRTAGMIYDQATTIVTFPDPLEAQVHRESAGGPIALRILSSLMDLRGKHVLFVNDCLPVILAMRKGSKSRQLQSDAEAVAVGILEAGARASFLHVPGTEMIAAGTDGASRDGAKRVIGPACTLQGRQKITEFLRQRGWEVTIDLFAADCNKFTDRYASWTDEPNSEAVDAFSLASWDQSVCKCGRPHRETSFIFPPKGLERAVFRRARSDGARAVFVVPTTYSAGYWKGLRARSTGQLELTNPQTEFHNSQGTMGNHTVFLVDFADADDRLAAGCGQESEPRGRRIRLNPEEIEVRRRTRAELARLDQQASSSVEGSAPQAAPRGA